MKKKIITAGLAGIALLSLAACGTKNTSTDSNKTKEVTALNGKVKVPETPKRVVIQNYPDEALALGSNVVGTDSWAYANPYLSADQKKGLTDLGAPSFNLQKLVGQKPDLIVTVDKTQVSDLEKVAPTVLVNYQDLGNLHKSMDYFADLLNRKDEEKAFFKKFDAEADKQKEKLKTAGVDTSKATASILELSGDKIYAYGDNFARGGQALTTGLGFKESDKMAELSKGAGFAEVNAESLKAFDADWLFIDYKPADAGQYKALQANPSWKELKAVKEGHVVVMDYNKVYFFGGPKATLAELPLYTDAIIKVAK
ncbi:ABC transporter substrate-binding protein [Lactococcus termiticola]|uniref:Ferrichrome ABC transporter substrate-binding protein n=1 Tax=Lactococcus termiticola TaxID=2169526 RepID=A0A2R5HD51_9LACT|nr:ABC transporter substrate-binding protein [Lactococcus termiticola]GBG96004.1 ferrichrome ABC transporter substrate-binding protein [Lactococcus termiticola]